MTSTAERFWRKVTKTDRCWLWTGSLQSRGYGCVGFGGKRYLAHRLAYEWLVGPIPDGLTIDHLCRVKACVNPAHLEPVTGAENTRRHFDSAGTCRHGSPVVYRSSRVHSRDCAECDAIDAAPRSTDLTDLLARLLA